MNKRVWWGVALQLAVWVPLCVKGVRNLISHNDFSILYEAAVRVAHGLPLYGESSAYVYPPLFALLLAPFTIIPCAVLGSIYLLAKVLLINWVAWHWLSFVTCRTTRMLATSAVPLLLYRSLDSDLVLGNTNVVVLALLAWIPTLIHDREATGRVMGAAAALATAVAIKLYPAYLIATFFCGGWRKLATLAAICAVLWIVVPGVGVADGVGGSWRGFFHANEGVVSIGSVEAGHQSGYVPGQSLRAFLHRWLTHSDATAHDDKHRTLNIVDWDRSTVETIYWICCGSLALLGLWGTRRRQPSWILAWGLLIALLITPYSRKAHFVLVLFGYLLVVRSCGFGWGSLRRWPLRLALLGWALVQLSSPALVGKELSKLFTGGGVFTIQALLLLVAVWWVRGDYAVPVSTATASEVG